jgi:hypothetical protein
MEWVNSRGPDDGRSFEVAGRAPLKSLVRNGEDSAPGADISPPCSVVRVRSGMEVHELVGRPEFIAVQRPGM